MNPFWGIFLEFLYFFKINVQKVYKVYGINVLEPRKTHFRKNFRDAYRYVPGGRKRVGWTKLIFLTEITNCPLSFRFFFQIFFSKIFFESFLLCSKFSTFFAVFNLFQSFQLFSKFLIVLKVFNCFQSF